MSLLHAGVDTSVIALWLGHKVPGSTHAYLHEPSGIASDGRVCAGRLVRARPLSVIRRGVDTRSDLRLLEPVAR